MAIDEACEVVHICKLFVFGTVDERCYRCYARSKLLEIIEATNHRCDERSVVGLTTDVYSFVIIVIEDVSTDMIHSSKLIQLRDNPSSNVIPTLPNGGNKQHLPSDL